MLSPLYERRAVEQLQQHARKNSVLKALSHAELRRLLPHMEKVDIETKQVIYQQGEIIEFVYFPTTVVLSMLLTTSSGETVELATVGREGFTGVITILNTSNAREHGALTKVISLLPGNAVRLKSEVFEAAVHASLEVSRCIHQYLYKLFTDLALSVSCNRLHSLQQRCARWLLTSMDKSGLSEIAVTQEMLADILGVHRQSIIQVLNEFEAKRLVQCERGSIQIQSTQGLAALVCECYHIGRKRLENIHGS
jgi:CRP-like cAMP-binding protein